MLADNALVNLRIFTDMPEHSLLDNVVSTKISCTSSLTDTCADPDADQGVRTPPPTPENHKIIGFPSNTGPDSLKIQWWAIIGPPAKRRLHDGPTILVLGFSLP